jgi:2-octaprenyl-6-methoxyphenol hydroxylase
MIYDVCVVGAGPVGGALACRLAGAGLSVAVVDRAALPPMEHPDFDGRAYAIAAGSRRLLEQAGLWDALPLPAGPIEQIRVSDGEVGRSASPLFLHFSLFEGGEHAAPAGAMGTAAPVGAIVSDAPNGASVSDAPYGASVSDAPYGPSVSDAPYGAMGWMVEARSFRVAVNARLHALPGIDIFAPAEASVTRFDEAASVTLSTGASFTARLVVAAEGRDSPLRRQAGLTVQRWAYHQTGIVSAIAHEQPHNRTALEHFLPAGPFAQLPMAAGERGENLSAIVWTERSADAPRYMALDDAAFGAEIARRLGGHLGWVRPVGRRWSYPLSAMYVHRVVATRLAVVGDAAHGIHPIAGQGLNLGLRDAIALSELLIAAKARGEDVGSEALLARYQRARRVDVVTMLAATDALDRLFSTGNPAVRLVRGLGIAAVHRMPGVKRAFMRQAMGQGR